VGAAQPLTVIRERYRLDALIGEGGMAEVWRAWDLTLQRAIAVKLLFARESHTEEALVDRFLREARIAASVQHRNVIHIVDFGTTAEGQPFMVMELLQGETLAARLRRQKPLPVAEVVQIGLLTLRGLAAVHAAGIVHRDLKPENVYLKEESGVVYPKILDFGISRSIDPSHHARSPQSTRDGVIVGTPEYMSPEQARGVKQLDYRTDLYSIGVVLYEALTGRLPYSSENVGDLIVKIVTGSALLVHEVTPSVPRAVSEVVSRAMQRQPDERFADATQMQEALLAASQLGDAGGLPMFSNLPPDPMPSGNPRPHMPRVSPRPANTLPRTQAVRMQMLAPASSLRANHQAHGAHAAQAAHDTHGAYAYDAPASVALARPSIEREFPLIEAAPMAAPPANDLPPMAANSVRSSTPGAHTDTQLLEAAPDPELDEEPLGQQRQWMRRSVASVALLAAGVSALSLFPAPHQAPPERPSVQPSQPVLRNVTLTLADVPEGGQITVDGEPGGSIVTLPRGDRAYAIAVLAPGKQPWSVRYVPNADQTLHVMLVDTPLPAAPAAAPAARTAKRATPSKSHAMTRTQGVLREPDF
jgi:serine/threonine-protein kinase